MEQENEETESVNESENKENKDVDEFQEYILLRKPANTKVKSQSNMKAWNAIFLVCTHLTRRPCWLAIQYNFFSQNLHNNKVSFPAERQIIVLAIQHGRRDVRCKPSIVNPLLTKLVRSR